MMFYGDANPVKAGMVSHPSRYQYSSYHYYAYGKKNRFSERLTPPPEYLALGKTPAERQKRYRERCDEYLRAQGLIDDRPKQEVVDCPRPADLLLPKFFAKKQGIIPPVLALG